MKNETYLRLKQMIEENLIDFLPEIDPKSSTLAEAMKYSLTAGGKRFRGVLFLAALEGCNKDAYMGIPYACAIEYIQTYSLIHDDLPALDDDDYRRGVLTNHKVFGEDIAILAGDGLLSAAYEVMLRDMLLYLDETEMLKRRIRASYEIAKFTGCRGMIAGQVADIEAEDRACSAELLDYIHLNKTAAFIKASIMAGCYLGGADKDRCEDMAAYGEAVGLAYQIINDIQDSESSFEKVGKNVQKDISLNKATYLYLHGAEESKRIAGDLLLKAESAISKYCDEAEVQMALIDYLRAAID